MSSYRVSLNNCNCLQKSIALQVAGIIARICLIESHSRNVTGDECVKKDLVELGL